MSVVWVGIRQCFDAIGILGGFSLSRGGFSGIYMFGCFGLNACLSLIWVVLYFSEIWCFAVICVEFGDFG